MNIGRIKSIPGVTWVPGKYQDVKNAQNIDIICAIAFAYSVTIYKKGIASRTAATTRMTMTIITIARKATRNIANQDGKILRIVTTSDTKVLIYSEK